MSQQQQKPVVGIQSLKVEPGVPVGIYGHLQIDENVPIAAVKRSRTGQRDPAFDLPWSAMIVGDSVLVAPDRGGAATQAARIYGKHCRPKQTYTSRKVRGGVRIWRIT